MSDAVGHTDKPLMDMQLPSGGLEVSGLHSPGSTSTPSVGGRAGAGDSGVAQSVSKVLISPALRFTDSPGEKTRFSIEPIPQVVTVALRVVSQVLGTSMDRPP